MAPNVTLEMLFFNPFIINENMNNKNEDPDLNFFQESVFSSLVADYLSPKEFKSNSKDYTERFKV